MTSNLPDDWGRYEADANFGAGDPCPECDEVHGACPHCEGELNCNGLCDDCVGASPEQETEHE